MVRALHRLSNLKVERAKEPGLYADGGGLYLRVAEGGSKQWVYRYTTNGHNRDMGLGPLRLLTLAEARERARAAGKLRLDNIDPIAHKRAQRGAALVAAAGAMTFKQCAEGYIRDNEKKWTHPKHRKDWERTLVRFVFPTLGNLPVASIDTPLVLQVIKPIWEKRPETASRVRGRIEAVLGWATVHHYRTGDNPARWRQHLEHALPSRQEIDPVEHHPAMPYTQVAGFVQALRKDTSVAARALELLTLTGTRLSETLDATWREIDLDACTWTIAAARMKTGKDHTVPLSTAAIAVLKAMHAVRQSDFVFPGFKRGQPIRGDALRKLIKRLAGDDVTVHGMRSAFRDWAAERTNFPREVAEMVLAHAIPDAVEAAYRRGDLFEKRRRLMDAWAAFCEARPQPKGATVTPMRRPVT